MRIGGYQTGMSPSSEPVAGEPRHVRSRPMLPGDDPFYRPPPGYENTEPGTVLRWREVELAFLGVVPQRFTAIQLLYRTTDMADNPLTTVTTVLAPTERSEPCPIVSYQCAIDALAGRCFPSYALRRRARAVGALAQFELLLIAAVLAEGWAVPYPITVGPTGCSERRSNPATVCSMVCVPP